MASLNKVIIMGNLTRDPESKQTNSGTTTTKMGMAINRRFRTGNGEQREETIFVDVQVWGNTADFCRDRLRKGASVMVEGRLKMDTWQDQGTGRQRSKLYVVAENVQACSPLQATGTQPYPQGQQQQYQQPQQQQPQQQAQAPLPPPFPSAPPAHGQQAPQQAPPQQQAPPSQGYDTGYGGEDIDSIPFSHGAHHSA